jgi:hypothetical protein
MSHLIFKNPLVQVFRKPKLFKINQKHRATAGTSLQTYASGYVGGKPPRCYKCTAGTTSLTRTIISASIDAQVCTIVRKKHEQNSLIISVLCLELCMILRLQTQR